MALYCIGDIQGCNDALERLLNHIDFSPSRDTLFILGDLVNRGPDSVGVLRRLMKYGDAARCLLGNHDLHLLAVASNIRTEKHQDTLKNVLDAPDCHTLLYWLRHQNMALHQKFKGDDLLMLHAGVLPSWTLETTLNLAREVEDILRAPNYFQFLQEMYGNTPTQWSDDLRGNERLRVIVNALTRMRLCALDGSMNFEKITDSSGYLIPWFDLPERKTKNTTIAFGHWSTLGWLNRPDLISLDTGCVWGGCLSACRLGANIHERELIQVKCSAAQKPEAFK